jgi:aspartate/methionine/tyrosine aminotransferase
MIHGESMKMWNMLKLGYTDSRGHPELRKEIASLYRTIKAEDILVMAPEEGIFIAMNTLLEKGDEVVSTFPAYQSLYEIARNMGCHVKYWKPRYQEGWRFELQDLTGLLSKKTRMLIMNFPNNPTGSTISPNIQDEIVELAKTHEIILFSDEMYQYLEHDESDRLPSIADQYEPSVTLFGMSKAFALPGLRIGWLITKNHQWLDNFSVFRDYTTLSNSAPSEILALMGLKVREQILRRNHEIIRYNLNMLDAFFSRYHTIFDWQIPKTGTTGFPGLKRKIDANTFCHDLLETEGVLLLPPSAYDFPGNHFRIGFGRNHLKEALEAFSAYIEENVNRSLEDHDGGNTTY